MAQTDINLALKENGEVWGCGYNSVGQLGNNTSGNSYSSPVKVVGNHSFIQAVVGQHALALKTNGEAWTWGSNFYGNLGTNDRTNHSSPVTVIGSHSFSKVYTGAVFSMALKNGDGTVWTWGRDDYGQLGQNTTGSCSSPIMVVGNHSFVDINAGQEHSCYLKEDGSAWCCGYNFVFTLGDGIGFDRSSPHLVVGNHSFISLIGGRYHTLALKEDGAAWAWGYNRDGVGSGGQLGDNSITDRSSPVLVVGNHSFIQIVGYSDATAALKDDGQIWTWGTGGALLANGDAVDKSSPVAIVGNHSFILIKSFGDCVGALKESGELWCWGYSAYGEIGDNTLENRSSPVLVVGNHSFVALDSFPLQVLEDISLDVLALDDGTAFSVCWGHDTSVEEDNIRDMSGNWTGTGTVQGSDDAEEIVLDQGQEMISEAWYTGASNVQIEVNKYQSGGTPTIYYKTKVTEAELE